MKPISSSAGTDCSTVLSDSRAISSLGLPSIWAHIEPEASRMMMTLLAAKPSEVIDNRSSAAATLRKSPVMEISLSPPSYARRKLFDGASGHKPGACHERLQCNRIGAG